MFFQDKEWKETETDNLLTIKSQCIFLWMENTTRPNLLKYSILLFLEEYDTFTLCLEDMQVFGTLKHPSFCSLEENENLKL